MIFTTCVMVYLYVLMELQQKNALVEGIENPKIKPSATLIFLSLALLVFISGFRVGFVDTPVYRWMFDISGQSLKEMQEFGWDISKEYGFVLFMNLLRSISQNSQILILVSALLILSIEFGLLKKHSIDFSFSLLLFFFLEFLDSMNGIRQILVAMIFLSALPLIKKRKFIPYLLLLLLLSTFHLSVLICLPFYFILDKKWSHPLVLATVGIILVSYLNFGLLENIVSLLFGSNGKYNQYLNTAEVGQMGLPRLLVQCVPVVLVLFYEHLKRKKEVQEFAYYQIFCNLLLFNALFNLLGTRIVLLARLSVYFSFATSIMIPYLLWQILPKKDYFIMKQAVLLMYLIYFGVQMYNFDQGNYMIGIRLIFWEAP